MGFRLSQGDDFKRLMKGVRENAAALAAGFSRAGLTLAYGGTDTHLCLVDLRNLISSTGEPVSADVAARVLDLVGITCNKNSIHGDTRALYPSGLRFGTCWVTQRGMGPDDLSEIASVVGDTLTSMKAFQVHSAAGLVGRVRLPASALRSAQKRVKKLVERREGATFGAFGYPHYEPDGPGAARRQPLTAFPTASEKRAMGLCDVAARFGPPAEETNALESGAALVDTSHAPVLDVAGERAGTALQLALSGDLLRLKPGRVATSRALDAEGRLIGEFRVARVADDAHGIAHYRSPATPTALDLGAVAARTSPTATSRSTPTCCARSTDRSSSTTSARPLDRRAAASLTVAGPKPPRRCKVAGLPSDVAAGELRAVARRRRRIRLEPRAAKGGANLRVHEIVAAPAQADALAKRLLAVARPVGEKAFLEWKAKHGAPRVGAVPPAAPGDAEKPWFIGQAALLASAPAAAKKEPFVEPTGGGPLKKTPLNEWHKARTKKWNIVDFAGWEMPVLYTSIVDEHRAVRTAAGLFDVSHMGCFEVKGEGAARFLDLVTTNYVGKLRDGEGQYSYALAPDGHVLDDLLVYRRRADAGWSS